MSLTLDFRPQKLEDISGQQHIIAKDKALYTLIKSGNIPHLMFFGPAGTGKTTLARVIASELGLTFYELDGSSVKVDEIRKILNQHKDTFMKPLIFVDEVHRLSKTQQEVLLVPMESNDLVFIGASTENPYFVLSSGMRSRSMLFEFYPLSDQDLTILFDRVQEKIKFSIDDEAKQYIITSSGGDARAMLNLLDFAIQLKQNITVDKVKELRPISLKDGVSSKDTHYNLASALIKSMRGSDRDAALYYLARLIDGGENPEFIARRLVIFASEDIGNADPQAITLAVSVMQAVAKIGYPESRIMLAQAVVYLASASKSNSSYRAINTTLEYIKNNPKLEIPKYLINTNPEKNQYRYPHAYGGYVDQQYLEKDIHFYTSTEIGYEKQMEEYLRLLKQNTSSSQDTTINTNTGS